MIKRTALLSAIFSLFVTGCTTKSLPADAVINGNSIDFSKLKDAKQKERCRTVFLGFPFGDKNPLTAAKEAGINKITYLENSSSYYIVMQQYCTIVYGE